MVKRNNKSRNFDNKKRKFVNKNEYIKAPEVLLINEKGENLGKQKTRDALNEAREKDLDLIELNPNSEPPVCKIMDYSKYLYDKKKKEKKNKASKGKDLKELKFSPVIQEHDIQVRTTKALKFLGKGHNVRFTIFRKGRQTKEQAKDMMDYLLTIFADYSTIEPEPKEEGRKLYITIKPDAQTKNKENSLKEDKDNQSKGEQRRKDIIQKESSTSSEDKVIKKIKEKETS